MSGLKQVDKSMESSQADGKLHTLLAIPANFYSIPFGLVGLARVWRLAGDLFSTSLHCEMLRRLEKGIQSKLAVK